MTASEPNKVRTVASSACVVVALSLAVACSDAARPLAIGAQQPAPIGTDAASDVTDAAGDAVARDGGVDARTDALSPDAGPVAPLACMVGFRTGAATPVALLKAPFSITPDELVAAWATRIGDEVTVHVAERNAVTADFVEVTQLGPAAGPFAWSRPALQVRGLDIALIAADRRSLLSFRRPLLGSAFETNADATFTAIQTDLTARPSDAKLVDVVWGFGGRTFFLALTGVGILRADAGLGADTFGAPAPLSARLELAPIGGQLRLPSGTSPDYADLLYFDEPTAETKVASRVAADYAIFASLGQLRDAQVSDGCRALYFSDGAGIVRVARK